MAPLQYREEIASKNYSIFSYLHAFQGRLYQYIADFPITSDGYFLASLSTIDGKYRIIPEKNKMIPPLYSKTLAYSFPPYYKGYYAFPLIGKIFPLLEKDSVVHLDFFPEGNSASTKSVVAFINSFVVSGDYVWLVMENENAKKDGHLYEFKRFNIRTRQVDVSTVKFQSSRDAVIALEPIKPDFVIFKSKANTLIRKRLFS